MSAASVLARGRIAAQALMQDTCTIRRVTGSTTDPNSGVITPSYTTVFSGPCRVQQPAAQAQAQDAGQAYVLMLRLEVHLPMTVTGLQPADEVLLTASALDPDLVGRTFLIRDLAHKSHATARRVGVEERTS